MLSNAGVALLPPLAGVLTWVAVRERTSAVEAWDTDLYWPVTLVTLVVLGFLFGRSRLPAVAFAIAALLFLAHIAAAALADGQDGVSLLPLAVVFWPVLTAVGGVFALVGVWTRRRLGL